MVPGDDRSSLMGELDFIAESVGRDVVDRCCRPPPGGTPVRAASTTWIWPITVFPLACTWPYDLLQDI